jgi:hypothetical protein
MAGALLEPTDPVQMVFPCFEQDDVLLGVAADAVQVGGIIRLSAVQAETLAVRLLAAVQVRENRRLGRPDNASPFDYIDDEAA